MKSNLNNIDEIFREGLTNFAHEPESGLWKKIAGKLLWREILHFNFTNLPAAWTGIAATGIVVTSLLVYNLLPTQNPQTILTVTENVREQTTDAPLSDASKYAQNIITDEPANLKVNNSRDEAPENVQNTGHPNSEISVKQSTVIQQSENTGQNNVESEYFISDVENATKVTNHEAEATTSLKNESLETESPEVTESLAETSQRSLGVAVIPEKEHNENAPVAFAVQSSKVAIASLPQENVLADSPEVSVEQTSSLSKITSTGNPEISQINPLKQEVADDVTDQSTDIITQESVITESEQLLANKSLKENKSAVTGKSQNMNSLSHTFGAFFKGRYKPPKRDFDEGAMELYRGKTKYFSISAYGAFEMTDYTRTASASRENTYLGGASVSYHSSKYVFQGGLEFSYMNDVGDYMVDMSTYDSVGFYYGVGEFVVDPENPDSVIFVIQKVTVYDSVQHQPCYQTQNSYSYLQIPLMIGYKAYQRGRFSAYINAGPSISILLNNNVSNFTYSNPEATVHSINNYSLPRLSATIQVLVNLSFQYQLSKDVGILVEPTYRYYIQGVYDVNGEDLKKPSAVGIKGGIYYNFW